ncbi:MAG: LytR/AlgR family response regulator transcription factor [Bacteroidia bacterium]
MTKLRTLIVEDEERSINLLRSLLAEMAPDIEIIGVATRVEEAIVTIDKTKPDFIFLDIELYGQRAFTILDEVRWKHFQFVFVTAYEEYALKAFRYAAVDYLLKPIDPLLLLAAVKKVRENKTILPESERMEVVREHLSPEASHKRITLPTLDGFVMEELENILSVEANGNYSWIRLVNGSSILVSRNIQEYEEILVSGNFFRVHRSHIINLMHVKKYIKGRGGNVVLSDTRMLPVAVRKKEAFITRLKEM